MREDDGALGHGGGLPQGGLEAGAVEDVVPQDQRHPVVPDELPADYEGVRDPAGLLLDCVAHPQAEVRPVAEGAPEVLQVGPAGYDEDVADAREHERGQREVEHGAVVDRQEDLGHGERGRVQPRAGARGEDYALHATTAPSIKPPRGPASADKPPDPIVPRLDALIAFNGMREGVSMRVGQRKTILPGTEMARRRPGAAEPRGARGFA